MNTESIHEFRQSVINRQAAYGSDREVEWGGEFFKAQIREADAIVESADDDFDYEAPHISQSQA